MQHQSSYRAAVGFVFERAHSIVWILLLPAAAECTASVWFPDVKYGALDLQLAALNVSGALIEGFFAAWEGGKAVARGPVGDLLQWIADDMRGSFLSTYTSWAGMVGFAAALAHEHGALSHGLAYMFGCVLCGFFAHGLGGAIATFCFPQGGAAPSPKKARADFATSTGHHVLLGALVAYIAATYTLVSADVAEFDDADDSATSRDHSQLPALFAFLDADENRLIVAMLCSIAGAASGNALGNLVDAQLPNWPSSVPAGTLVCNTLFAVLGVSLNAATLRRAKWARSVLLQSFAGSFCGAASAFAGHASDARSLYGSGGSFAALKNSLANLALSIGVFFLALEVERMLSVVTTVDANADGVVQFHEIGVYYGMASGAPCTKPPLNFLGLKLGGGQPC